MHLLALAAVAALNLQSVLLPPTTVGKGYNIYARNDGFGVKAAPTLDLCGRKGYASEKLRIGRLQVNYLKSGNAYGLSNEIVHYKAGGAKQALREVLQHASACPKTPVATGEKGVGPLAFTITPLHDGKLLAGYVAVKVRAVGKLTNGQKVDQTSYAVYQQVGDVLSGVYSFGPNTKTQLQFVLRAAEASARLLQKTVKPSGPPA